MKLTQIMAIQPKHVHKIIDGFLWTDQEQCIVIHCLQLIEGEITE